MIFKCRVDTEHKFSLDKPEEFKETSWAWKGKVHCPYCGTDDLEEVMQVTSMKNDDANLAARREENEFATRRAQEQAAQSRRIDEINDPTVTITNTGAKSQFAGPAQVKTSFLKKIDEKAREHGYE